MKILNIVLILLLMVAPVGAWQLVGSGVVAESGGDIPNGWTLQVSDDFNRSDGDLSSPWTTPIVRPIPKITSQTVTSSTTNTTSVGKRTDATSSSLLQMACVAVGTALNGGPSIRNSTDDSIDNRYDLVADIGAGTLRVRKVLDSSPTNFTIRNISVSVGDTICLAAEGTFPVLLEVFINGSSAFTESDSSADRIVNSGYPGICIYNGIADNFNGYYK